MFAEVVIPVPLDKTFHYSIPEALRCHVRPGVRVRVPFGRQAMIGYVLAVVPTTTVQLLKDICSVVDTEPVVTDELLTLARWLSYTYVCSLGEALACVVPPALQPLRRNSSRRESVASVVPLKKPELTGDQKRVVAAVSESIHAKTFDTFLLHGVTSSGKTEVYLSLIEQAICHNRSAIFLLPEISLTPQFISIVKKRFSGLVGIWHSRLSAGERYLTWDNARKGTINIMLGARSALFAPFNNLGLIIVDEEHEPSYKQEQKPAYQTRDVAMARAELSNAVALFGSATPSLEMYRLAQEGSVHLLEMLNRVDGRGLPAVSIVRPPRAVRNAHIIAPEVHESITRILMRREQAIVFLNRRGFAPGVICHECGTVWQCPNCSVSLVYHREPHALRCHYCDHSQALPEICPKCKSRQIALFGVGTQKVEEELKRLFPQVKLARLDRDTTSKKGVYEQVYNDFKDENFDILVGTQIVAKGFDFPRVTFAGVIDADTALYLPDFRAAERTFQLITQVAGRPGRSDLGGHVIVQSLHPEYYALSCARKHDYQSFYRQEVEFRKQLNYPPFCHLVSFLIRSKKEDKAEEAARHIGGELNRLKGKNSFDMLGPAQAARYKLHNFFRWQILLKGSRDTLVTVAHAVKGITLPSGILLTIDIDPQSML